MSKSPDYQTLQSALNQVIESLKSQDVDIDEAVKLYERGLKLVGDIEAYLKTAENKIETVKTNFKE